MRHYGSVYPQFWTGKTGRTLCQMAKATAIGRDCQRVALYLMTSPHANMLGLYWLPLIYLCEEVGIDKANALKVLVELRRQEFCFYDDASEHIWVKEMARFQIGAQLSERDCKLPAINRLYQNLPDNPWLGPFFDRYASALFLTSRRDLTKAPSGPPQGGVHPPDPVLSVPLSVSSLNSDGEGSKGGGLEAVVIEDQAATPEWVMHSWNSIAGVEPFAERYYKPAIGVGKKLISQIDKHPEKAWWNEYFSMIRRSSWLIESFHPVLDWGLRPTNIQKVLQGNYIRTVSSKPRTVFGQLLADIQKVEEVQV